MKSLPLPITGGVQIVGTYLDGYRARLQFPNLPGKMQEVVVDLSRNEDAYHTLNVFDETGRVLPSGQRPYAQGISELIPHGYGWRWGGCPHYDAEGHWCCSGRAHWLCEDLVGLSGRYVAGPRCFLQDRALYETGLSDK